MYTIDPKDNRTVTSSSAVLMPISDHDYDVSETSIPWKIITSRGYKVAFSTENGEVAHGDESRLKGSLPGLLSASKEARIAYPEMVQDYAYLHPISYAQIDVNQYQAIVLPGGDAKGMRRYLENEVLQKKVLEFKQKHKLIGAICHGTLVAARTIDPGTGKSILYGHKVTAIPKSLDRTGFFLDRLFTRHGYVMYPKCVADEVQGCLADSEDFSKGSSLFKPYVVSDGDLVTSRWYLDAQLFAETFCEVLDQHVRADRMKM